MMWMILQAKEAEDWVIATGKTVSIRDFVILAFQHIGIELEFKGSGLNETAEIKSCKNSEYILPIGKKVISVDKRYFRPTEVDILQGDPSKARNKLGWKPEISLNELVNEMMNSDLILMKKQELLKKNGYDTLNSFE